MRVELISYLEDLADEDGRQRAWAEDGEEFDQVVHFLYDDTPLSDEPARAVGFFLADEAEVAGIRTLIEAIERLFRIHGNERGNVQVGPHAEWEAVKARAREALRLVRRPAKD